MQKSSWTTRLALQRRHSSIKFVAVSDAQGTAINGATHYIVPVVKQAPSPVYPDSHAHAFRQLTMRFTSSIPDADGVPILGSDEQTATITEAAAAPASPPAAAPPSDAKVGVYPDKHETVQVAYDEAGHQLDKSIFMGQDEAKAPDALKILHIHGINGYDTDTLFKGTDATKELVYIQITKISPTNGAGQRALYLTRDQAQGINIIPGDDSQSTLDYTEYAQLHWDGAHNEGGSFKFIALGGDRQPMAGHTTQTVTVTEATAPAPQAGHDQEVGTPPSVNAAPSGVTGPLPWSSSRSMRWIPPMSSKRYSTIN
ncbi:MAG: hypothetical protein Q4B13_04145 [Lautropia sp.]|nr:hypothetical protein [Lautropia sp.]